MSLLEDILSKATLNDIGTHIGNYTDLFVNPLTIWRKVVENTSESYIIVILHLIYYCIFVYFIMQEVTVAIPAAILEACLIIIPFLIFLLPFLIFVRTFKIPYQWKALFRLFLILKLQFIPLFILLYQAVRLSGIEDFYIITDNFIDLFVLSFVIVLPLIIKITFWKKVVWTLTNYIFLLLATVAIELALAPIENSERLFSKLSVPSPTNEYIAFEMEYPYSSLLIADDYYLIQIEKAKDGYRLSSPQFVTRTLLVSFLKTDLNKSADLQILLQQRIRLIDSILAIKKKPHKAIIPEFKPVIKYDESEEITIEKLDSCRTDLNQQFYKVLAATKKLKDSSKFEGNRKYFAALDNYLSAYERSYINWEEIRKIVATGKVEGKIELAQNRYAVMIKLDSTYYGRTKVILNSLQTKIEKKVNRSNFLAKVIYFPIEVLFEAVDV